MDLGGHSRGVGTLRCGDQLRCRLLPTGRASISCWRASGLRRTLDKHKLGLWQLAQTLPWLWPVATSKGTESRRRHRTCHPRLLTLSLFQHPQQQLLLHQETPASQASHYNDHAPVGTLS